MPTGREMGGQWLNGNLEFIPSARAPPGHLQAWLPTERTEEVKQEVGDLWG